MTRYRDSKTGRFVSHATWKRSKAHGGTRYKRVVPKKPPVKRPPPPKPPPKPKPLREYFVVLNFSTRKRGRTVTRRLYEAIVTLPDGATQDEILKAYQQKVQEQHPKLHNAEIERLLFGPNAGRTTKIIPRDTPGSDVPSGSIRANDARKPKKRKGKA